MAGPIGEAGDHGRRRADVRPLADHLQRARRAEPQAQQPDLAGEREHRDRRAPTHASSATTSPRPSHWSVLSSPRAEPGARRRRRRARRCAPRPAQPTVERAPKQPQGAPGAPAEDRADHRRREGRHQRRGEVGGRQSSRRSPRRRARARRRSAAPRRPPAPGGPSIRTSPSRRGSRPGSRAWRRGPGEHPPEDQSRHHLEHGRNLHPPRAESTPIARLDSPGRGRTAGDHRDRDRGRRDRLRAARAVAPLLPEIQARTGAGDEGRSASRSPPTRFRSRSSRCPWAARPTPSGAASCSSRVSRWSPPGRCWSR